MQLTLADTYYFSSMKEDGTAEEPKTPRGTPYSALTLPEVCEEINAGRIPSPYTGSGVVVPVGPNQIGQVPAKKKESKVVFLDERKKHESDCDCTACRPWTT